MLPDEHIGVGQVGGALHSSILGVGQVGGALHSSILGVGQVGGALHIKNSFEFVK